MRLGKIEIKSAGIAALAFAVIALAVSLALYKSDYRGERRVFYFESLDEAGLFTEVRYLMPYSPGQGGSDDVCQFVSEAVLGPATSRFRNIFSPGTRLDDCFVRDGVLYLNFSAEALAPSDGVSSIRSGTEIMERSVLRNFPAIEEVLIFIDDKPAYENRGGF